MSVYLKRFIAALLCMFPLVVQAENQPDHMSSVVQYLATADEYRQHAANVQNAMNSLPAHARADAGRLIAVLERLADVKERLADAVTAKDWSTEERLEKTYYRLKAEEQRLWDAVEAAK